MKIEKEDIRLVIKRLVEKNSDMINSSYKLISEDFVDYVWNVWNDYERLVSDHGGSVRSNDLYIVVVMCVNNYFYFKSRGFEDVGEIDRGGL